MLGTICNRSTSSSEETESGGMYLRLLSNDSPWIDLHFSADNTLGSGLPSRAVCD